MRGQPLTRLEAVALPLMRDDVNTDAIIPSREMKTVSRLGLADGLFADWRYRGVGSREPEPGFVLNDPAFAGAAILLAGTNFGCGSSREHAAWALAEYGFHAIVAASFNPIFRNNAALNGIAPVVLPWEAIQTIAEDARRDPQARRVVVDLDQMIVVAPNGDTFAFSLEEEPRRMLREGLDAIDLTLTDREDIDAFMSADRVNRPWAY